MNDDQMTALNDTLRVFFDGNGVAVDDDMLDNAVWAVVNVIEEEA
jgi:hypothetical protein